VGGACSTYGIDETFTQNFGRKTDDVSVDGRMKSELILKK